jgi:hypothetical protein
LVLQVFQECYPGVFLVEIEFFGQKRLCLDFPATTKVDGI